MVGMRSLGDRAHGVVPVSRMIEGRRMYEIIREQAQGVKEGV